MRLRRAFLQLRVNAQLQFRYDAPGLTSFAGLELVRSFFARIGLRRQINDALGRRLPPSDFGVARMVLLVLALIITGGRRLRHVKYLHADPIVGRFCGLAHLPTDRSLGRWLSNFDGVHVDALQRLNENVAARNIRGLGLRRLTLDVDGSVLSTGLKVKGARRGFNPHHRKVPSYYPITAYEAQSGQLLRVQNRAGNIHDGAASLGFLNDLIDQVRCDLPEVPTLEFRMDSAFFREDVLDLMDTRKAEYAIKVPFWKWIKLQEEIQGSAFWYPIDDSVSYIERRVYLAPWQRTMRVLIYRKRVAHETAKNFQLDLFDPNDGHFEYSAITTNKSLSGPALWSFMGGRGAHEKAYAELKSGFAFGSIPSMQYHANSAWQVFSVLAFNLMRGMQLTLAPTTRARTWKRRTLVALKSIHTLRFEWINRAGLLVHPNGQATLDVGNTPSVGQHFQSINDALLKAA